MLREHRYRLFRERAGTATVGPASGRSGHLALRSRFRPSQIATDGLIDGDTAHGFLEDLRSLDITVDEESFAGIFGEVHRLAVEHRLSGYDAAYLELAVRKGLPLATLDEDLKKAASAARVGLFESA